MNDVASFQSLLLAALALGAVHSLAPDHWLPFAALSRARGWSASRTTGVTLLAGGAHLGATLGLALAAAWFGGEAAALAGDRLATAATYGLLAAGLTVAAWALSRRAGRALAGERASRRTVAALCGLFALDPCVPLLPLLFAALPLGGGRALALFGVYALSTLTTMVALAVPAALGLAKLGPTTPWRPVQVAAGLAIAAAAAFGLVFGG